MVIKSTWEAKRYRVIVFLLLLAIVCIVVSITLEEWWVSHEYGRQSKRNLGLFIKITCPDWICRQTDGQDSAVMEFVKVLLILSLCLNPFAMFAMLFYICYPKQIVSHVCGGCAALAGCIEFIAGFTLVGFYYNISKGMKVLSPSTSYGTTPPLWFKTLPLFFILMACLFSAIGGIFTFVNLDKKEDPNRFIPDPVKEQPLLKPEQYN